MHPGGEPKRVLFSEATPPLARIQFFLPLNDNSIIERGTAEEEPEADTLEAEHRGPRAPIGGLDTARRATDRRCTVGAEAVGLSLGSDVRSASSRARYRSTEQALRAAHALSRSCITGGPSCQQSAKGAS
jgi:hypothetical protein